MLKRLLFGALAALLVWSPLQAKSTKGPKDCNDPDCKAWQSGVGSKPGKPTTCIVTVSAPTFGGKIALDVRREGRVSRWGAPRIKHLDKPGTVTYRVGCGWFGEPTAEVYLCAEGFDGKQFVSIRWRFKGHLDDVLKSRRLQMCLKGRACPDFVEGDPPR